MMKAALCLAMMSSFAVGPVAFAAGADEYIKNVQVRLKPGKYEGRIPGLGGKCSVEVKLENHGKGRRYSVHISPTLQAYATDNGPTVIAFASSDSRVLFQDSGAHAVSNAGDDYLVLGIRKRGERQHIRAYVKRGQTLKTAECEI